MTRYLQVDNVFSEILSAEKCKIIADFKRFLTKILGLKKAVTFLLFLRE